MSELIQRNDNRATIRWKLLTGASALALASYMAAPVAASAEDSGRPTVWLELSGGLSRLQDKSEIYSPPFLALEPSQFSSPLKDMRAPRYGLDAEGAISIQPEDSNWIFSASIRYGRADSKKHVHQQSYPVPYTFSKYNVRSVPKTHFFTKQPVAAQFIDTRSKNTESHDIVDFQVGRDVGLGLFGHESSSSLNLGVRIAQFTSKSSSALRENPDWDFQVAYQTFVGGKYRYHFVYQPYHSYGGQFAATRSFHGVGPSLSLKSSMPFAGNAQDGALTLDWGVNAALLFGRQKSQTQHYETAQYHPRGNVFSAINPGVRVPVYHHPTNASAYHSTRSRNATVPNVGGSVGLSWNVQNFKMSLGYKADFFFGAIDGGIDAAKKESRAFYGPYASISIGFRNGP